MTYKVPLSKKQEKIEDREREIEKHARMPTRHIHTHTLTYEHTIKFYTSKPLLLPLSRKQTKNTHKHTYIIICTKNGTSPYRQNKSESLNKDEYGEWRTKQQSKKKINKIQIHNNNNNKKESYICLLVKFFTTWNYFLFFVHSPSRWFLLFFIFLLLIHHTLWMLSFRFVKFFIYIHCHNARLWQHCQFFFLFSSSSLYFVRTKNESFVFSFFLEDRFARVWTCMNFYSVVNGRSAAKECAHTYTPTEEKMNENMFHVKLHLDLGVQICQSSYGTGRTLNFWTVRWDCSDMFYFFFGINMVCLCIWVSLRWTP